ncbi:MAG: hypothetical protein LIO91_13700 [Bacteroidales bacterium]|nr:hypothetical protein [Bacteroidales bacterium]
MERAASAYGKLNRIDVEDEQSVPFDQIVPQPYTATDDPTVLGITPIPNINEVIARTLKKYSADNIDIEDVTFEEADLEFDTLFPLKPPTPTDNEENLLQ